MEDDERLEPSGGLEPPWVFRGQDLSRLLALSDGVFAFAMTLLVLGLVLPVGISGGGVSNYIQHSQFQTAFIAYILSFFVIGIWWQAHHLIFGYIRRYDRVLVRANSVFLVTIAVLPFGTIVLDAAGSAPFGVGFFAAIQVAAGLSLALTWRYASGPGHLVRHGIPESWKTYLSQITIITPVVFVLSIPAAFWSIDAVNAGELVWLGAFVVPMAIRHKARAGSDPSIMPPSSPP